MLFFPLIFVPVKRRRPQSSTCHSDSRQRSKDAFYCIVITVVRAAGSWTPQGHIKQKHEKAWQTLKLDIEKNGLYKEMDSESSHIHKALYQVVMENANK